MQAKAQTIENIKKVSLIFFIITGILHLGSYALITNSLWLKQSMILNKTMDIPVIITGMTYGLSSLRLNFADKTKPHKNLDIFLLSLIILTLIVVIAINLVVPNI